MSRLLSPLSYGPGTDKYHHQSVEKIITFVQRDPKSASLLDRNKLYNKLIHRAVIQSIHNINMRNTYDDKAPALIFTPRSTPTYH